MSRYLVTSKLGERRFALEDNATDYQIKLMQQVGVKSEVVDIYGVCEKCGERCGADKPYGADCRISELATQPDTGGEQ